MLAAGGNRCLVCRGQGACSWLIQHVARNSPTSLCTIVHPAPTPRRAVAEHSPKLLFLTSPNNPDGSVISDEVRRGMIS